MSIGSIINHIIKQLVDHQAIIRFLFLFHSYASRRSPDRNNIL